MATEYLNEKINTLRNQLQQMKLQVFNNELVIADAETSTGNDAVDKQLKATADSVKQGNTLLQRQIEVRTNLLAVLEAELAQKNPS